MTLGIFTLLTIGDFARIRAGGDGQSAGINFALHLSRGDQHLPRRVAVDERTPQGLAFSNSAFHTTACIYGVCTKLSGFVSPLSTLTSMFTTIPERSPLTFRGCSASR